MTKNSPGETIGGEFPIFDIVEIRERDEPIGSKAKFWFRTPKDDTLWLFKKARESTGEDWAEKIAAEIADVLGLPHAIVELATHQGQPGIISKDFTESFVRGHLFHGNEVLFDMDPKYPKGGNYRIHQHTIAAVRSALERLRVELPNADWAEGVVTAWDGFIGYLLLDALISNTDRHHQNWGLLAPSGGGPATLAPTFDHASSLGRELDDAGRQRRLTTRDRRGGVAAYVSRARSAFYAAKVAAQLSPIDAFAEAARAAPVAGRAWLARLERLSRGAMESILVRMPGPTMSDLARRFALALMNEARDRLVQLDV